MEVKKTGISNTSVFREHLGASEHVGIDSSDEAVLQGAPTHHTSNDELGSVRSVHEIPEVLSKSPIFEHGKTTYAPDFRSLPSFPDPLLTGDRRTVHPLAEDKDLRSRMNSSASDSPRSLDEHEQKPEQESAVMTDDKDDPVFGTKVSTGRGEESRRLQSPVLSTNNDSNEISQSLPVLELGINGEGTSRNQSSHNDCFISSISRGELSKLRDESLSSEREVFEHSEDFRNMSQGHITNEAPEEASCKSEIFSPRDPNFDTQSVIPNNGIDQELKMPMHTVAITNDLQLKPSNHLSESMVIHSLDQRQPDHLRSIHEVNLKQPEKMKFVDFLTSHDSLQQEKENVRPTVQQRSKQEHANLDSTASVGDAARQRMMDNCAQNLQLPTEPDQLPDISYEQSFLPPTSGVESSLIGHNNNIGDSHSSLNEQGEPRFLDISRYDSFSDATPSRPDRLTNNLYARQEEPREVNPDLSPDIFMSPVPTNVKEWETPAATKQYMNDLPTRTAIARRVESFQIPPERLAALQPEIVAMQNQNRKPSDKLSLKESSAQIDALLNENWGLKMKIMFMDQHFEQDREKAELIAENVRLQTNGFNFVQQVKARDKTIRSLQKQVEDLEFRHAGLTSSCHELQVEPEECINQKIQELEHYIDILEQEHDKVVLNLETNLGNATRKLEELDVSQVSENHPNLEHEAHSDELVYNEMRTSLMEAEAEIRDLEEEFRFRIAELEDTIADRDRDVVDYRAKLLDISESLKSCEIDLAKSDRLRQDTIEEIRDIYESERVEYELYIEDRHEEIDNLKQAIKSYNQDSFEARLKEALKPHQKAWLDLNRQYDETREEAERQEALHRSKLQEVSRQLEHRADNQRHLVADLRKLEMQLRHKEDILAELRLSVIPTKHSDDDGKDGTSTQQDAASTDKQFPLQQNALEEQREKNFALLTEIHSRQELLSLLQEELEEARGENKALAAQSELDSRKLSDLEELCQQYQDQIIDLSAEVDNAKHAAERLEHDMTKQVEKDRNVIENLKQDHRKQQESDAAHSAELELQLARASDNLDSIRSTMMEFFNPDTGDDLGTALQDYLNRMQAECLELHESVEKLTVAHKSITSERDESERGANDRHNEIKLLKANLSRTVSEKENLESQIHKLESQLLAARSSLSEVQNNTTEAHRVLEKSLQRRSQLSIQFILKLRSMLGDTNGRNKFDSIMDDHNEIKSAFQGLIQELSKRLQEHHSSAGPRTIDMEKRIEELEALLDVRLTTEEAKQTELQQVRDELESLRTLQKNSLPTKAQGATGFKRQELTRKPSLLESISKTSGEEYWTLHERIRVLTQDLKYQKELREQDDKAAKSRLAEAKREKRTLQDIVPSSLDGRSEAA